MAHIDEDRLFKPYVALFETGDRLRLKPAEKLGEIHARWIELIEKEGIPVDWCPPREVLDPLSDTTFQVKRVQFFHGGVPLYILSYVHNGQSGLIRLCESLLTRAA